MAILRNKFQIILILLSPIFFSSCFTDFTPKQFETPVLYMNSLITSGKEIKVFVNHTSSFLSQKYITEETCLEGVKLELYVNDHFVEIMELNGSDKELLYTSKYTANEGDKILLRASHPEYGQAEAEVIIPQKVNPNEVVCNLTLDNGFWIDATLGGSTSTVHLLTAHDPNVRIDLKFNDPNGLGDCYTLEGFLQNKSLSGQTNDGAWDYATFHFNDEPIFSEHVSALEKVLDMDSYGCAFFSDRKIDGKSYSLRLSVDQGIMTFLNPIENPNVLDIKVILKFSHITKDYYNYLLSQWKVNDGFEGQLSSLGFAEEMQIYSNVSTGAGIIAARTVSECPVSLKDALGTYFRDAGLIP